MPQPLNPCLDCGGKAKIQDFGELVFVKCKCGRTSRTEAEWNQLNPPQRPMQFKCGGPEYLAHCRDKSVNIHSVEIVGSAHYRLTVTYN